VLVVFDQVGREPVAEEMTVALVTAVEVLCVAAVEPMHSEREVGLRPAEEEVVVGAHQAIAEAFDVELGEHAAKQPQEHLAIAVVRVERALGDSPGGHMPGPIREQVPRQTRHRGRS
jgi:hypothetical protein